MIALDRFYGVFVESKDNWPQTCAVGSTSEVGLCLRFHSNGGRATRTVQ